MSVVSSGDVIFDTGSGVTTSGGNITALSGATFTTTPGTNTFNISGGSGTGGSIFFNGVSYFYSPFTSATTSGNTNGGNITLVAFPGTNVNSGLVDAYGMHLTMYSGGNGTGNNGSITVIAGAGATSQSLVNGIDSIMLDSGILRRVRWWWQFNLRQCNPRCYSRWFDYLEW